MRVIPHARQVRRVPHTARLVVEERRAGEVPCACWPRWACYSCWAWAWLSGYGPMACSSPACCSPFPSPDWWNGCVPRNGLGSCVRRISSSPWRCLHGARSCRSSPTILHGCRPSPRPEPGLGHGLRQVAAPSVSRTAASRRSLADAMRSAPVAFGRRALDMGVAADRALVRPWHRPSPDAGDDAGRPAWIRSGPGPRLLGRGAARVAARAGQGARILAGHSFAHAPTSVRNAPSRFAWRPSASARVSPGDHDNVGHLLTRAIMQAQAGKTVAKRERYGRCARVRHVGCDVG